jgi:hypothetical protein
MKTSFDTESRGGFDGILDELHAMMNGTEPRRRDSATASEIGDHGLTAKDLLDMARPNSSFAKAMRQIGTEATQMLQAHRNRAARRSAEVVVKAFDALRNDENLTPLARGELMIGLNNLADRVFAKAHPMVDKIDRVKEMLDRALAEKHVGAAEPLIKEALQHIRRGVVDKGDWMRLTVLLNEIKTAIKESTTDEM